MPHRNPSPASGKTALGGPQRNVPRGLSPSRPQAGAFLRPSFGSGRCGQWDTKQGVRVRRRRSGAVPEAAEFGLSFTDELAWQGRTRQAGDAGVQRLGGGGDKGRTDGGRVAGGRRETGQAGPCGCSLGSQRAHFPRKGLRREPRAAACAGELRWDQAPHVSTFIGKELKGARPELCKVTWAELRHLPPGGIWETTCSSPSGLQVGGRGVPWEGESWKGAIRGRGWPWRGRGSTS